VERITLKEGQRI